MTTVKEQIGEVLLGTAQEPQLSQQTRAVFMKHAIKDEATGELYLGENEFIDAVAPETEDYVNTPRTTSPTTNC
jgi:solute carrier family 25 aspartate/glutamate transporter 12/13